MTTKETILACLTAAQGRAVSGAQMAAQAGVSRAAVWKAICALRDEGYEIDAVTRGGYTLRADGGRLTAAAIAAHLHTPGISLAALQTTDSTNTRLRVLAEDGAPEGTVVAAAGQTAGRGRSGKSFLSPAGTGIYLSILLRPALTMHDSLLITTAAAVAVARAVERVAGCTAQIKWVNDVYVNGKKVCGILRGRARPRKRRSALRDPRYRHQHLPARRRLSARACGHRGRAHGDGRGSAACAACRRRDRRIFQALSASRRETVLR